MIEKWIKNDLTKKRYRRFKSVKRSVLSVWIFGFLLFLSATAEFWANSKPLVLKFQGQWYVPVVKTYHPSTFGIEDQMVTNYREIKLEPDDFVLWPAVPWDPYESNTTVETYPAPPSSHNLFGTDDRGRDVMSRLIYGFRYSIGFAVWFGFFLISSEFLPAPLWVF